MISRFQNDLSLHVTDGDLNMYAHDNQVYVKDRTTKKLSKLCHGTRCGANPEKFQSINIIPRKLDKEKSDIILDIHDLNIVKAKQIKRF